MKKLYVGNLPKGCTSQMLSEIFEKFGTVNECDVIRNYGFVHMTNETEAQEAVTNLDDSNFMGSNIMVQFSTTDVHKTPGVGSQGECFRCGNRGHLSRECPEGGTKPRRRGGRGGGRGAGGYRGGRERGGGSRDYWDSYYYDYPPPRRLPPPGYDYDRRPPPPRDYGYPLAYRSRSRSPPGRRPPPDMYMRRGRSPPREYGDYYDRPPMPRDYYDMPPQRRDAPVSYPLPAAYKGREETWDKPGYGHRGGQGKVPPYGGTPSAPRRLHHQTYQGNSKPLQNGDGLHGRAAYPFTNGTTGRMTDKQFQATNGAFTEDIY